MLICPEFNGYNNALEDELRRQGYDIHVIFYNEYKFFSFDFFTKNILRISNLVVPKSLSQILERCIYYEFNSFVRNLIPQRKFKYLLVIKGLGLTSYTINKIDAENKILYQWDDIKKVKSVIKYYRCFDKVFTFSQKDSELGFGEYLPNFINLNSTELNFEDIQHNSYLSVFFVGEYSIYREKVCRKVIEHCKSIGIDYFIKLVDPSRRKNDGLVLKSFVAPEEYRTLFDKASIILDISRYKNSSPSQRGCEAFVSGKLVFSDKHEEFMRIEHFIKCNALELNNAMLQTQSVQLRARVSKYCIDNWVKEILR